MTLKYEGDNTYSVFEAEGATIKRIKGGRFNHFKDEEMFESLEIITDKGIFVIDGCSNCYGIDVLFIPNPEE